MDHWAWNYEEAPENDLMEVVDSSESSELASNEESVNGDDEVQELTENPTEHKYIFCDVSKIIEIIQKCRKCENPRTNIHVRYQGLTVWITVICDECSETHHWSNTKLCDSKQERNKKKLTELHLDITSSIITSGNSFQSIKGMFDALNSPFFTPQTFNRLKSKYVYDAIGVYYNQEMEKVVEVLQQRVSASESLHLCGDGSFDSRGHSALFCRYVIMDAVSKLVINYEVIQRKSGDARIDMEKVGCEKSLQKVVEEMRDEHGESAVSSFTTDRSKSVALMISKKFSNIDHFFDSWHYIRGIALEVFRQCSFYKFKIVYECEHQDIRDYGEDDEFLSLKNKKDVKALNILMSTLEKGDKLNAIKRVSPFYATSSVESFNARAAFYACKDHFYTNDGFKIRTQLAVIDWNSKKFEEASGIRQVIGEKPFYNKTTKQYSTRELKTPANYSWRREILNIAMRIRFDESRDVGDDDDEGTEGGAESYDDHDFDPDDCTESQSVN
ncbi:hypothetical protein CAEBREN_23718 [Caenorhabditis brenneri]|uniref:Uncharacterized protein n=1 Tax=Caenorhabditis brenneri TaxID=135651 RepID=G0NJF3_CAEBE|nr:hypothetical protein CAEBREN_23718 [Caenorhabditis brenneri]